MKALKRSNSTNRHKGTNLYVYESILINAIYIYIIRKTETFKYKCE